MMRRNWWVKLAAGVALSSSGIGCGGIGPGDYIVYRIALQQTKAESDCYENGQQPPAGEHSSTLYTSDTFILYATDDESFYLDVGPVTLKGGAPNDDTYEFEGAVVDVGYISTNTRTTNTASTRVELTVDGEVVEGTYREQDAYRCVGTSCPSLDDTSCTLTTPFVGTEVEDVQIKHEV